MKTSEVLNEWLQQPMPSPSNEIRTDHRLYRMCTSAQWNLLFIIMKELKAYNMLWHCDPKLKRSSSNCAAIKGLITMGIMSRTETTNIYTINPQWVRRGEHWDEVMAATAKVLEGATKVGLEHIIDLQPVSASEVLSSTSASEVLASYIESQNETLTDNGL